MKIRKIEDLDLNNKKVFLRCDFNVPLNKYGEIADFQRINSTLETIEYLLKKNCSIIIASHLWRPKWFEKNLSLKPVQKVLRALLRWPIILAPWITDEETISLTRKMKERDILILENLRFDSREKENDKNFAKDLAFMADYYINDAFGVSHREHASLDMMTNFFEDDKKAGGFLMQKEISYFYDTIRIPKRPFVAILWWSKISGKLEAIKVLLTKIDSIIIWWAMAFTFLKAMWYWIWKSLVEDELLEEAIYILELAKKLEKEIILPVDFVISDVFWEDWDIKTVAFNKIPDDYIWLDIWDWSIKLFEEICSDAKTIFWNGPMWAYEFDSFFQWSAWVTNILARSKALTFVWWGDSISVIKKIWLWWKIDFISTWWGASLQLLEGKNLIGIEKLIVR